MRKLSCSKNKQQKQQPKKKKGIIETYKTFSMNVHFDLMGEDIYG